MKWTGPYTVDQLLDSFLAVSHPRPPEGKSVYLVSKDPWTNRPATDCSPLYAGSNTGRSMRFRTRVGALIADMFGFFGTETGHHSGGQTLHRYCKDKRVNPKELYIGWVKGCGCP